MTSIPEEIRPQLSPGEQLLWWARPRQGLVLRAADAFSIPFSLMWCAFAIFWEASVLQAPHAPAFFVLWGIPFIGVGIYLVIGRFFVEARQRSRTYYAVTPERILIVSGLLTRKVKSLNLRTLTDVSLSEGKAGVGTIWFGPRIPFANMIAGWRSQQLGPHFDLIGDAKSVYEIILKAQRATTFGGPRSVAAV